MDSSVKDKIESLDQALLFFSSFLSFGFSAFLALILQSSIGQVVLLLPLDKKIGKTFRF